MQRVGVWGDMMKKTLLTNAHIRLAATSLATSLVRGSRRATPGYKLLVWGIPRGGVSAAMALVAAAPAHFEIADRIEDAEVIVDDLIDTGATMRNVDALHPGKTLAVLYSPVTSKILPFHYYGIDTSTLDFGWLVFPWEASVEASADDIVTRFLSFIGEDPNREGLKETPKRVIAAWGEWFAGYNQKPAEVLKAFTDGAESVDEMVLVRDIPVYSHCEHHLAPFFGVAHVGYIPSGRIVGLSKIPRLVDVFSRRLQVQERLTNQIADALAEEVMPKGVGVVLECRHLCMESRGIRRCGTSTVTSAMRGVMMSKPEARSELLSLVRRT